MSQPRHLIGIFYLWFRKYPSATFGMIYVTHRDSMMFVKDSRVEFEKVFLYIYKRVDPPVVNLSAHIQNSDRK